MSSSVVLKRIFSIPILAVVAMQLSIVQSVLSLNQTNEYLHHICMNRQGTYKSGSKYERDLNNLIKILSISISGNKIAFGNGGHDLVNIKLQCRGDSSTSMCRSCLSTAFSGVTSFEYYRLTVTYLHILTNAHMNTSFNWLYLTILVLYWGWFT